MTIDNPLSNIDPDLDLNLEDALRLIALDKQFAGAFQASPDIFSEIFNLSKADVRMILDSLESHEELANNQLTVDDALRLAENDERFAHFLSYSPGNFKSAFNLSDADLTALEDILNKAVSDIQLGLEDLLRLAANDEKFARVLLLYPGDFQEAFNLEPADFDTITRKLATK